RKKDILLADEVTAALDVENSQMVRDLIFSLPMMVLEIAHHIDDESRYDQVIELRKE
ncbi:ABC transporter ATP-binding protein, partial [Streptococcus parasanguinis]|nr:ABC transporter ATP-binding protein [Streptococcus parasanguinis]